MTTDVLTSSLSCSTLRSQEDTSPTQHPAVRSLKTSRRDEISEGFDSLSGLLSDLRSAQDDAQQEVSRALKERDKLLSCLQNKDENDDRMQDFLSQLTVAESRCSNLHDQLDYMKQMYTAGGERRGCRPARRVSSPPGGPRRSQTPRGEQRGRVQQYIVQRRRSLSRSTHPPPSRPAPERPLNGSSPSLRRSEPRTTRSPGRRQGGGRGRSTKQGVRVRAESLIRQTGGRRDRGDETDADGDHLWCDRGRPRAAILAHASKYVPGSVQELRERSRAASLASRGRSPAPARASRPRRRAASESAGRPCGPDSGIDSDSECPSRLARQTMERERRTRTQRDRQYQMGRAPLPFLSSSNTNKSHHIGANIQHVMSLARRAGQTGGGSRPAAPLPDVRVGRLPARGPFLRHRRRRPFRYHDKMEIDKYKIEVDPRSCGPDNTADFARYERDRRGCVTDHSETREVTRRGGCRPATLQAADEDARSAASAQARRLLASPGSLRRTRRSLKRLLEELAEEFAGLEGVCQRLEADLGEGGEGGDRRRLEGQIGRLETMMEERRRQVCCLLKLYRQIKRLSRGVAGAAEGGSVRGRRPGHRGLASRPGRPMRVNTRIQPSSVRPRGVTFSMQKSFPLRPLQPRPAGQARPPRRPAASRHADPAHCAQLKVLRDMRNIQRRMRIELGEEY